MQSFKDINYTALNPQQFKNPRFIKGVLVVAVLFIITLNNPSQESPVDLLSRSNGGYSISRKNPSCVTIEKDLDHLVAEAKQVFITIPPKAAGTSLKSFAKQCIPESNYRNNFLNFESDVHDFLTASFELPKLIASHLYGPKPLTHLIKSATRDTLIILIYREDTERKTSAIKHILQSNLFCGEEISGQLTLFKNETTCIIKHEQALVDKVIKENKGEIGSSMYKMFDCDVQEAIAQNDPNMVMINYKQVGRLQHVLEKKFCPELLGIDVHENVAEQKAIEVFVELDSTGELVSIDDWLHEKEEFFDWSLDSKVGSCRAATNAMQDHLFSCKDESSLV